METKNDTLFGLPIVWDKPSSHKAEEVTLGDLSRYIVPISRDLVSVGHDQRKMIDLVTQKGLHLHVKLADDVMLSRKNIFEIFGNIGFRVIRE